MLKKIIRFCVILILTVRKELDEKIAQIMCLVCVFVYACVDFDVMYVTWERYIPILNTISNHIVIKLLLFSRKLIKCENKVTKLQNLISLLKLLNEYIRVNMTKSSGTAYKNFNPSQIPYF